MTSLERILDELAQMDNADKIRLNDGADTWAIDNLLECAGDDDNEYIFTGTVIDRVNDRGYSVNIPAYIIEYID